MKMMVKWILREFRNNPRFVILFVLNLSLGLSGFIALDSFKVSLKKVLDQNSKNFLSADLGISARRKILDPEMAKVDSVLGAPVEKIHLWEFFSMVSTSSGSKLVQLKAIESQYPFYGEMLLGSGRKVTSETPKEIISEMKVWVYPELLIQLNLKVGDHLRLGNSEYQISDTVEVDSTQTFRLSSLAPKIYGGIQMIERSGLVEKGTTFTDAYLYKIPEGRDPEIYAKKIFEQVSDPGFQVATGQSAAQDSSRALGYLSDYLGLVSLVALFLSGIGAAYLYRSFFSVQLKSVATLHALGLTRIRVRQYLVGQILILGLVSSVISILAGVALFPMLSLLLREFSPLNIPLKIDLRVVSTAFLMSVFGSFSISLPFLLQIGRLSGSQLFQEENSFQIRWRAADFYILVVPLMLFWGLSVVQANSIKVGSLFYGLLCGSLIFLAATNWIIFQITGRVVRSLNWKLKYIGLQLSRRSGRTLSCALALSLGTMLICLLPQIKSTIRDEIATPNSSALPALFVFDIQENQVADSIDVLKKHGINGIQPSPLVRARILSVNGAGFEKVVQTGKLQTREEETEARFRNRGFNLTYRDRLSSSENLVSGQMWDHAYDEKIDRVAQISVEEKFAERLKFKLGDVLNFDVQGVEIQGQITSLRSVKWNSFQPNFFVVFQPGVLNDAPKSFLMAIPKALNVNASAIQSDLVGRISNLSIVDVGRTVEQILSLSEKMSWSLELMAALCLIVGFLVLFSIVGHQVRQSQWDQNLLKIFGASAHITFGLLVIEYAVIGLIASTLGAFLSLCVAKVLAQQVFEAQLQIDLAPVLLLIFVVTFLSGLVALLSARRVFLQKPQLILQG